MKYRWIFFCLLGKKSVGGKNFIKKKKSATRIFGTLEYETIKHCLVNLY